MQFHFPQGCRIDVAPASIVKVSRKSRLPALIQIGSIRAIHVHNFHHILGRKSGRFADKRTRIWFSFSTAHPEAVEHANSLGMEVVEVGRCPVYYLDDTPLTCRAHTALTRLSGTRARPPQKTLDKDQRIMW